MLEIINLTKTYKNGKKAVEDFSLTIRKGDIYAFLGNNGAGKTTTLNCCVGIIDFESGDIKIDGNSIKYQNIKAKQLLGYIPSSSDIYGFLKGSDYLNFICDIYKVSNEIRNKEINYYVSLFELEEEIDELISSYSLGTKQKLIIIGALVHDPDLILMDEPFLGLDPKSISILKNIIIKKSEEGKAILYSTHILDVAEKLCNKVAIIKNGKLIANGNLKDIIENESLESKYLEVDIDESTT